MAKLPKKKPVALPKAKTWPFEQKLAPLVGPILLLVMVAVSAFLLGRSYQSHLTPKTTVAADAPAASGSAIDSIQSAIATGSSASSQPNPASSSNPKSSATPKTAASSGIVNINTADLTALETLNGIGPSKAQAIIDYRNQNGPFTRVDDLDNVKGIGPATIDKIRSQITV
ncbi:MAG TPA: ComEA family DNA-binding protein [Candidatus Saccharimonadales bacterium]|nr:ComEA family DNA-binding protein [Candidatus Saccharimonadales bacterium]